MRFAQEYVRLVLEENFEDAKRLFLEPLLAVHRAHLVMLAATSIVSRDVARRLRLALDEVSRLDLRSAQYDSACEDLFYFVEALVTRHAGEDAAGRLHTARSRNDIDMTMYRMRVRARLLETAAAALDVRASLLDLIERHHETIFVAHTHTQRAQPTTMAHYGLGVVEQLERDLARLKGAFERTNWCPLGACAITGTGFPIDRGLTAALLGFAGPMGNTYGSIATVDYLLESMSAVAVLLVGLGRFVQDLLFWSTAEVGYLRLGDGFVQTSSLMPQKRNPVAFEHARALGSAAIGRAQAVALAVHNTPFGDIVDTEDDLQPLADSAFGDALRATRLLAAALRTVELDPADLEAKARDAWTTLTELADTLVRDHDLPFRTAHDVARRFMTGREHAPDLAPGRLLADASREICGRPFEYADRDLDDILCPRRFVGVRATLGGPSPAMTIAAAAASRAALAADRDWRAGQQQALLDAEHRLAAACAAL